MSPTISGAKKSVAHADTCATGQIDLCWPLEPVDPDVCDPANSQPDQCPESAEFHIDGDECPGYTSPEDVCGENSEDSCRRARSGVSELGDVCDYYSEDVCNTDLVRNSGDEP